MTLHVSDPFNPDGHYLFLPLLEENSKPNLNVYTGYINKAEVMSGKRRTILKSTIEPQEVEKTFSAQCP